MVEGGHTTGVPLLFLPPPDRTKLVFKDVTCSGYLVEAIVDTGSGITVVSPKLSKLMNLPIRPWLGSGILLADGQKTIPKGQVDLSLTIDNVPVSIPAVILDLNGFDLLLGNDVLSELSSITIEYGRARASFFQNVDRLHY